MSARILVLGYGNPGRQDDGLGPALAIAIERLALPNVTAHENYQLVIEDALDVAEHDVVWFVDASKAGPTPYFVSDLSPSPSIAFTSHAVEPEVILAIARAYFGGAPRAFLLGIRGYAFEFVEELTSGARNNLDSAFAMLRHRIVVNAGAGP
jgi:hydrogenase maturation protease